MCSKLCENIWVGSADATPSSSIGISGGGSGDGGSDGDGGWRRRRRRRRKKNKRGTDKETDDRSASGWRKRRLRTGDLGGGWSRLVGGRIKESREREGGD